MTMSSGQASVATVSKVTRLRKLLPTSQPARQEPDERRDVLLQSAQDASSIIFRPAFIARFGIVILAVLVAAGQAVALPILGGAGGADPWFIAAAFGITAAIGAKASTLLYKLSSRYRRESRQAPDDLALHDALSLALVIACAAITGWVSALLLLPSAILLSRVIRRIYHRGAADGKDASLLLIVMISIAGMCQASGIQGWIAALSVLLVAGLVRTLCKMVPAIANTPIWRKWMVTALVCAAIAMMDMDRATLLLPAVGPLMLAMLAGVLYGAVIMVGAQTFSRASVRLISASVPFLAIGMEVAGGAAIGVGQIAAALLIAGMLANSNRYPSEKPVNANRNVDFTPLASISGTN